MINQKAPRDMTATTIDELERAIATLDDMLWELKAEIDKEYAGDQDKFNALVKKRTSIELAIDLFRSALDRERNEPPTVRDALLKRWREDDGAYHMADATIHRSIGGGFYTLDLINSIRSRHISFDEAIESQIAYLNSPAEVEK